MAGGWDLKLPSGVVPKNLPIYVALGFASVVIVAMVFTGPGGAPAPVGPDPDVAAALDAAVADVESVVAPVIRQSERLSEDLARLEAERAAEAEARQVESEREREQAMRDARRELEGARAALLDAQRIRDEAERTGLPAEQVESDIRDTLQTVEERDLREALRLQEVERMVVSLRSPAVVADSGAAPASQRAAPPPAPAITGDPAVDRQLLELMRQELPAAEDPPAAGRRRGPEVVEPAVAAEAGPGDGDLGVTLTEFYTPGPDLEVGESSGRGTVAVARWADVPEGMDLVYEGRMMQAVLETQLTGDFTGPARARLTLPVRTADRARVVIPRGAVALGQAQAVENGFQARLAVTFDRLLFGDGRSVRLGFEGLSALGETGLADEVNRHYMSTLGAVGAVGLLAGLSAGGGAGQGYFDPARQQFSVAAIRFLDRFMNRLPEVTVRAGHPVRIYLTQDLLVPRG